MHIYVAVVSHGHADLIRKLDCISGLQKTQGISVFALDNLGEESLSSWCIKNKIIYIRNEVQKGFGENNNIVFNYIKEKFQLNDNDYFLVLNPDVFITGECLIQLSNLTCNHKAKISSLNLYSNYDKSEYDNSVRNYPGAFDFFNSFFLKRNSSIIDKRTINLPTLVDWAAGSFLLFNAKHYERLDGFDTEYYMYCEDIDICLRSDRLYGERVLYFPQFSAIHLAHHANRSIFSKHFYWHLRSIARYLRKRWFGVK